MIKNAHHSRPEYGSGQLSGGGNRPQVDPLLNQLRFCQRLVILSLAGLAILAAMPIWTPLVLDQFYERLYIETLNPERKSPAARQSQRASTSQAPDYFLPSNRSKASEA